MAGESNPGGRELKQMGMRNARPANALRSQALKAQEGKETGNEEG
jgi:hypothetical protein